MNREIKYKGLSKHGWIIGTPVFYESGEAAIFGKFSKYGREASEILIRTQVDPETIVQFTGLKDKNGKEIYEGDIVHEKSKPDWHSEVDRKYVIEFGAQDLGHSAHQQTIGFNATPVKQFGKPSGMDSGRLSNGFLGLCWDHSGIDCTVIGNIYENPELLNN